MKRALRIVAALAVVGASCTTQKEFPERTEAMFVGVRLVGGADLPGPTDPPLPLVLDGELDLEVDLIARRRDGSPDPSFNGFVRITCEPGTVVAVTGPEASGRNVRLTAGQAAAHVVRIRNARGATRIWAEDIGYQPGDPAAGPACANGLDDDGDGKIDFPNDPGCAFANDDTEGGGLYAAGVSQPIYVAQPRLGDVQGRGATTPFEQEGVEVATQPPNGVDCAVDPASCPNLIVTRISSDGFYVTDTTDANGFNHMFAFTFNAPGGLRVCDRITSLSGTAVEFFGFTELSFPSFELYPWRFPTPTSPGDGPCQVPEPVGIDPDSADDGALLERIESALVRIENGTIGANFGPEPAVGGFGPNKSSCDLDGNGFIDFETPGSNEADCANACGADPQCVEWTGFASRGNYRVVLPNLKSIQVNTRSVSQFDPVAMRGKPIRVLTGTLRNFSGGSLRWTVEARCADDLVCDEPSQAACATGPKDAVSSQIACVFPRTSDDPNEATN